MSKREDRPKCTQGSRTDFTSSQGFSPNYGGCGIADPAAILEEYEREMKPNCHPDVLTWHCIVLENFLRNFLPAHGYLLMEKWQKMRDDKKEP